MDQRVDEQRLISFLEGLTTDDLGKIVRRISFLDTVRPLPPTSFAIADLLVTKFRSTGGPGIEALAQLVQEIYRDKGPFITLQPETNKAASNTVNAADESASTSRLRRSLSEFLRTQKISSPIPVAIIVVSILVVVISIGTQIGRNNAGSPQAETPDFGPPTGTIPTNYQRQADKRKPKEQTFLFCSQSAYAWLRFGVLNFSKTKNLNVYGSMYGYGSLDGMRRIVYNSQVPGNVGKQQGSMAKERPVLNILDDACSDTGNSYWHVTVNKQWTIWNPKDLVKFDTIRKLLSTRMVLLMKTERAKTYEQMLPKYKNQDWWLLRDLCNPAGKGWAINDGGTSRATQCRIAIDEPLNYHSGVAALVLMYEAYTGGDPLSRPKQPLSFTEFLGPFSRSPVETESGQQLSVNRFDDHFLNFGDNDVAICYESDAKCVTEARGDLTIVYPEKTLEIELTSSELAGDWNPEDQLIAGQFIDFMLSSEMQDKAVSTYHFHAADEIAGPPVYKLKISDADSVKAVLGAGSIELSRATLNNNLLSDWDSAKKASARQVARTGGATAPAVTQLGAKHGGRQ